MRYHGEGLYQWDTWCHVGPDGLVHAFYLQQARPGGGRSTRDADSLGHATSRNLIDWEEQSPVVAPAPVGELGDLVNWTGSTVRGPDGYYLFYTIRSSRDGGRGQSIGLATSPDLWTWTKHPDNPVLTPDGRWYDTEQSPGPNGVVDCRDLMVVKHPSRPGWFGVFATRLARGTEIGSAAVDDELPRGAVFGGAYSEDLVHWEQTGPVFRSDRDAYSIVEMPDLFQLDGRWYLTFLEDNAYGNRDVLGAPELSSGTLYAVADRIEGPYREPDDNVLMASRGFNGISCRTVLFRDRLHVTYTSCERELENETKPTFGVLSLPKELRMIAGRPRLCFADVVAERVTATLIELGDEPEPVEHHGMHESRGRWTRGSGRWVGEIDTAWARRSFAPTASDQIASVTLRLEVGMAAGLMVRQVGNRGAVALLDAGRQQVSLCTVPRFQVIDARPWSIERGRDYRVRVVGNGEFVEVFLDDELVLQTVWYGSRYGDVGLLVDRGRAEFRDLELLSLD
jgi:beta-fructofuranosidase